MFQRFRDTKDEQSHSDTSGENHRKVRGRGEFRRFMRWTHLDVAVLVDDPQQKEEKDTLGSDKEPGKVESDLSTPCSQDGVGSFRVDCCDDTKTKG